MLSDSVKSSPPEVEFRVRYIFYFAIMLLALLALLSYAPEDAAVLAGGAERPLNNWIGRLGAHFGWWMFHLFGLAVYLIALLGLLRTVRICLPKCGSTFPFFGGLFLTAGGLVLLLATTPEPFANVSASLGLGQVQQPALSLSGGVIGQFFAAPGVADLKLPEGVFRQLIGAIGVIILGWAMITGGLVIIYLSDWHELFKNYVFGPSSERASRRRIDVEDEDFEEYDNVEEEEEPSEGVRAKKSMRSTFANWFKSSDNDSKDEEDDDESNFEEEDIEEEEPPPKRKTSRLSMVSQLDDYDDEEEPSEVGSTLFTKDPVEDEHIEKSKNIETIVAATPMPKAVPIPVRATPEVARHEVRAGEVLHGAHGEFVLPPVTMLTKGVDVVGENQEAIDRAREKLQSTLDSFGIPGEVSGYTTGPRVTRYEITLAPGVNVKKVEQISDNIAMSLSATSVRVLAPIQGRSVVGVEVSNSKPEAVFMRSVMESEAWRSGKAEIPIALGKDVSGKPVIMDLAKAPHLLVAGATGTGKSVCTNSLIVSLLFSFRPDELKLIMVDPKVVEFEDYKRLPHLLTPLINESAKVPIALRWAANEMDRRYHVLARVGVKKLSEFNSRPQDEEVLYDDEGKVIPQKMPIIIIIIDELADLMMTEAKKDVENSITRIAQKGRAAGIHVIVATQRPSTNVITGIIKANLPTRLCFQVRSMVDSRVVLDTNGAEKLLGTGDMLYLSPSSMNIERVQGAWVKDADIKNIVKFVSDQAPQHFNDQVLIEENSDCGEDGIDEYEKFDAEDQLEVAPIVKKYLRPSDDDTFKRALEVVIIDRKASTSYLQRRLKIGYNRSAEIIDIMEERGIVGPPSGSGNKREILIFDGMEING